MPTMDPAHRTEAPPLAGDPPNPINPPSGCRFRTRCPFAEDVCAAREPLLAAGSTDHRVACHMAHAGIRAQQGAAAGGRRLRRRE